MGTDSSSPLACTRPSVSADKQKKASEQWNSEQGSEKWREDRRGELKELVSIFLNTTICPLPCQLPEKPFLVSKCQSVKSWGGFHMLDMFVRLCTPVTKWLTVSLNWCKLSQLTNRRVYPESVYLLLQWDIENNVYRLHCSISPQPSHSSCATFVDPLSPLSAPSPLPICTSTQVAMVGWCMNVLKFHRFTRFIFNECSILYCLKNKQECIVRFKNSIVFYTW